MPVYPYSCTDKECPAHNIFDIEHSIKDDAVTTCPECGKDTLERKIGETSFKFAKGSPTPKHYI
jgi:putative FmdB family regulatory protein